MLSFFDLESSHIISYSVKYDSTGGSKLSKFLKNPPQESTSRMVVKGHRSSGCSANAMTVITTPNFLSARPQIDNKDHEDYENKNRDPHDTDPQSFSRDSEDLPLQTDQDLREKGGHA